MKKVEHFQNFQGVMGESNRISRGLMSIHIYNSILTLQFDKSRMDDVLGVIFYFAKILFQHLLNVDSTQGLHFTLYNRLTSDYYCKYY